MVTLVNGDKKHKTLFQEIETGQIKIPQFQRQFVWDKAASAKLIDSVLKGYPIGTFIYWSTRERLRSVRSVGNIELPEPEEGQFVNYVLDGQQRITSLFAALKGETIVREGGQTEDFSKIYIDLTVDITDAVVIVDITEKQKGEVIRLTDLMLGELVFIVNNFDPKYHQKITNYKDIINAYEFRGINLQEATIDEATEVFTRLNVGGKALSLFEIMVAKTFDAKQQFDLYEKFQELQQDLQPLGYDTISSATILQLLAILLERDCTRKTILRINREAFIDAWDNTTFCLKRAIFYLIGEGIPVSRLLPYNSLLIPLAYFFHIHSNNPSGLMKKRLDDFFWRISLGFRYSSSVESKLAQDIDKIDKILEGQLFKYEWEVDVSPEGIMREGYFSTSKSFVKAILCLYTMQNPTSFDSNQRIRIVNEYLKIGTSKNYHYFFPKVYLKKHQPDVEYWQVNHVLNITLVDPSFNKNKLKSKAPADYLPEFNEDTSALGAIMKTHLINDLDTWGVWTGDFQSFFHERAKAISQELNNRIILTITKVKEQGLEIENVDLVEENNNDEQLSVNDFKQKVIGFVVTNKTKEALEAMRMNPLYYQHEKQLILLQYNYASAIEEYNTSILSAEEYRIEKGKVSKAILDILDE